ncbi:MAG: hypothetical protein PHG89_06195, partial [Gallionella sp.]|nr:hypothetical protein [Gallionella sp.]
HGDLALELVDGAGEVFGSLHIEVADGLVEDQYARAFEQGAGDTAEVLAYRKLGCLFCHFGQ